MQAIRMLKLNEIKRDKRCKTKKKAKKFLVKKFQVHFEAILFKFAAAMFCH